MNRTQPRRYPTQGNAALDMPRTARQAGPRLVEVANERRQAPTARAQTATRAQGTWAKAMPGTMPGQAQRSSRKYDDMHAPKGQILIAKQKTLTNSQIAFRFLVVVALFALAMLWVSGNASVARYNSRNYQMRHQIAELAKQRTKADADAKSAQELSSLIAGAEELGLGVPALSQVQPMKPSELLCPAPGDESEPVPAPVAMGFAGFLQRIFG